MEPAAKIRKKENEEIKMNELCCICMEVKKTHGFLHADLLDVSYLSPLFHDIHECHRHQACILLLVKLVLTAADGPKQDAQFVVVK